MNPKQLAFVDQYMVDRNGTQAAIRAGYSPKSAKVTACRMLTNANVKAEIDRRVEEYSRTAGITVVDLLEVGKKLVFADIRKLFDERGRMLHPTEWPDDVAPAVAGMDITEEWGRDEDGKPERQGTTKKVRMIDKSGPLFKLLDFMSHRLPQHEKPVQGGATVNVQINAAQAVANLRAAIAGG